MANKSPDQEFLEWCARSGGGWAGCSLPNRSVGPTYVDHVNGGTTTPIRVWGNGPGNQYLEYDVNSRKGVLGEMFFYENVFTGPVKIWTPAFAYDGP